MALTVDHRPVLHAANLYKRAGKDVQRDMRRILAREVNPWLRSAINRNARGTVERKIAASARLRSGQRPAVVVGGRSKVGSGGGTTAELAAVYEFGGYQEYLGRVKRRDAPRAYNKHTQRQIPRTDRQGRFIYPAVADAAPMLVRAWVEVIAELYTAASDGGR